MRTVTISFQVEVPDAIDNQRLITLLDMAMNHGLESIGVDISDPDIDDQQYKDDCHDVGDLDIGEFSIA